MITPLRISGGGGPSAQPSLSLEKKKDHLQRIQDLELVRTHCTCITGKKSKNHSKGLEKSVNLLPEGENVGCFSMGHGGEKLWGGKEISRCSGGPLRMERGVSSSGGHSNLLWRWGRSTRHLKILEMFRNSCRKGQYSRDFKKRGGRKVAHRIWERGSRTQLQLPRGGDSKRGVGGCRNGKLWG